HVRQLQVLDVMAFRRPDTHVAVDAADLVEPLALLQDAERQEVRLDLREVRLLVGARIAVGKLPQRLQVGVQRLLPGLDMATGDGGVAGYAVLGLDDHVERRGSLVEEGGGRSEERRVGKGSKRRWGES